MHETLTRVRAATALLLALCLLVGGQLALPAAAGPRGRDAITIEQFMTGLACIESSGRFTATNARSGAYGKYQIMPRNWVVWAGRYLRDRWAQPTPQNQEFVARARIAKLYRVKDSWRRVAYWWLTGRDGADETRWSRKARGYVDAVMAMTARAASRTGRGVPQRCVPTDFGTPDIRSQPRQRVGVAAGSVYVRRAPGYENRMINVVRRGEVLPVLDRDRDARGRRWLKVGLRNGQTGWVAAWLTRER